MFTDDLPPNSSFSVASALIMRGLLLDWSLFFLMYFHSLLIMSVRVMGESPTTAASLALGVSGFQNADFGFLRFMCLPPWTGGEMSAGEKSRGHGPLPQNHSQFSAPPVWYSVTRVS